MTSSDSKTATAGLQLRRATPRTPAGRSAGTPKAPLRDREAHRARLDRRRRLVLNRVRRDTGRAPRVPRGRSGALGAPTKADGGLGGEAPI